MLPRRYRFAVLAVWSICVAIPTAMRASAKPLWHDEIYTVLLARLPSISAQWAALRDGVDFAPPLNGFITRLVRHAVGLGPVAVRLPAMAGFWTMAMVIFAIVRERSNAALALAAICIPLFTAGYRYSYEARPYGLMMGLAALAWFAWVQAVRGRRRGFFLPLLGVSLAAGLWNHYYAALVYLPIAAGEVTRAIRARRIDVALWAAVAASVLAAWPLAPLIRLSASRTTHFWVAPSFADVPASYAFLFRGLVEALAWPIVGIVALALWGRSRVRSSARNPAPIPAHEVAALLVCLLIPMCGVLIALFATGGFVPRYAMPAVFGAAVALPLVLDRLARGTRPAGVALLGVLLFTFVRSVPPFSPVVPFDNPVDARPLLADSLRQPGPTAIAGELMFLQLWFYAPPTQRTKLIYLSDPERALRYRGSDIVELNYLALARWTAVPVDRFDTFVQRHDEFRMYAAGAGWQVDQLRDLPATLTLAGTEAGGRLFLVRVR
jgi:hypothetical protein